MKVDTTKIKETLALSVLSLIGEIYVLNTRTIETPFFFESDGILFAGILTDFIIENTGKPNDPFVLENEFADVVNEIKNKVGLSNAKVYNPIRDSTTEVEGLPFGTGDCFVFSL
jgi:hypothetical protein